jgi:hypothetical protein
MRFTLRFLVLAAAWGCTSSKPVCGKGPAYAARRKGALVFPG